MSFFSIIVPVYNAEKYIRRCIDSISSQTFTDIEIIAINDGSIDNSLDILKELSDNDPRIKVFTEVNSGQVTARNTGISKASGDYIGFVDADDYIEEDLFQAIYDEIVNSSPDIVMFDALMHKAGGDTELMQKDYDHGYYDKDKLRTNIYPNMLYAGKYYTFGCYPCLWNKFFRKNIIAKANKDVPVNIRNGEDACASYGAMLLADSLSYLKGQVGYHYIINETSVTQTGNHSTIESVIEITDYLCESPIYKSEPVMYKQVMYYGCVIYTSMIADIRKSSSRVTKYQKLSQSVFGQKLCNEYKNMDDLPAFDKCLIEGIFHQGLMHEIKMLLLIIRSKMWKPSEV